MHEVQLDEIAALDTAPRFIRNRTGVCSPRAQRLQLTLRMRIVFALSAVLFGCGPSMTPGAQPHDMSVAQHEAMARQEDRNAAEHAQKYDPAAGTNRERCLATRVSEGSGACWTSIKNPTAEHLEHTEAHRKMGADHRAASAALRDAEAKSCSGISAEDRDMSPFAHKEDIVRAEPLFASLGSDKNRYSKPMGAVVEFRAVPGMTQQWLQRVVDCHIARNAALGHVVPEMPYCPLVPKDVTAIVKPTAAGFAVEIRSDDVETAREIARRAESLHQP